MTTSELQLYMPLKVKESTSTHDLKENTLQFKEQHYNLFKLLSFITEEEK